MQILRHANSSHRHVILAAALALLAFDICELSAEETEIKILAPQGVTVSSILRDRHNPASLELLAQNVDVLTSENAFKTNSLFPGGEAVCGENDPKADFSQWLRLKDTAENAGLPSTWHIHPVYFPPDVWPTCFATAPRVRSNFIKDFAEQIEGAVSIDILNEPLRKITEGSANRKVHPYKLIDADGLDNPLKRADVLNRLLKHEVLEQGGDDPIQFLADIVIEFRAAMNCEQPCSTSFVLNEIGLSWGTRDASTKRRAAFALVEELRLRGAVIDAIGVQAHLSANPDTKPKPDDLREFLTRASDLSLDVFITELDVDWLRGDTRTFADKEHGELLEEFLTVMLSSKSVTRLGFWGLADIDSGLLVACAEQMRSAAKIRRPWHEYMQKCSSVQRPALFEAQISDRYKDGYLEVTIAPKEEVIVGVTRALQAAKAIRGQRRAD